MGLLELHGVAAWVFCVACILKMAEYNSIFGRMLFDICFDISFEVEYFDLESSFFCFAYYLS